jgi:hypothetical protein
MSLKDYVCSGLSTEVDNGQTRLLSGVEEAGAPPVIPFGECTVETLEIAKKNLCEQFAIVGLTESFDETLILLKRALCWRDPFYIKANVAKNRPRRDEIPEATLKGIIKHNELDIQLYQCARGLFRKQIERCVSFDSELQRFRSLNRHYGRAYAFLRLMVDRIKRISLAVVAGG